MLNNTNLIQDHIHGSLASRFGITITSFPNKMNVIPKVSRSYDPAHCTLNVGEEYSVIQKHFASPLIATKSEHPHEKRTIGAMRRYKLLFRCKVAIKIGQGWNDKEMWE